MSDTTAVRHRVVLLRHGKSEWPEDTPDHERPLTPRGRRDAAAVGSWLAAEGIRPDLVVVSTARRAQATWQLAQIALVAETGLAQPPRTESTRDLYAAPARRLLDVAAATAEDVGTLMLVGHNPGMEEAARMLEDGQGDEQARAWLFGSFPTCAIAVLDLEGPWRGLTEGGCRLYRAAAPRG